MLFVAAMVVMSLSGALMEALNAFKNSINVVAGLLTFYFVTTALLTVRRRHQSAHWMDRAAVLFVLIVSVLAFGAGFELSSRGRPEAATRLHLRDCRATRRRRRHPHDACRRHSGAPSYCTTSVAHVLCDVGCRRVVFLGTARQSP